MMQFVPGEEVMHKKDCLLVVVAVGGVATLVSVAYLIDRPGPQIQALVLAGVSVMVAMLAAIGYVCVSVVVHRLDEMQEWLVEHLPLQSSSTAIRSLERHRFHKDS